jgi:hypothetical protein
VKTWINVATIANHKKTILITMHNREVFDRWYALFVNEGIIVAQGPVSAKTTVNGLTKLEKSIRRAVE